MPPLGQVSRQALCLLLCASLVLTSPGLGTAFAQAQTGTPEPTAAEVMKYLDDKDHSIFKGPDDPLRSYIKNSKGGVTPLGLILYKYLKAQANTKEEVAALDPSFESLRKKGVYTESDNATMDKSLKRLDDQFKKLLSAEGAEDTFTLGAQREAIMTGIASGEPPKQDYTQVDLPDNEGWEFWDKEGVAFKMNHNRVIIYNRELQKQQRELNKSREARAPFIPETGRYNVQMIENSYWRLRRQHEDLELSYHMDRMLNMAELLGKQYLDDLWLPQHQAELEGATKEIQDNMSKWQEKRMWNKDLEAKLEKWAKAKTFSHKGQPVSVWDIVENKTKVRGGYLTGASEGIARFKSEMDAMTGLVAVTDSKVASMQSQEAYVLQRLSLAYLENQKYYVKNQLERLDENSPDFQAFEDAMDGSVMRDVTAAPMDAATKAKYKKQRAALQARLQRLMEIFETVRDTLKEKSYASNLDIVQAALNSSQKEMGEVALDAALFMEVPSVWGFADKQIGWRQNTYSAIAGWFGSSHSERMSEVESYKVAYKSLAGLIADGNYKDARALVIKMHPDAAKFRALGLDGVSKVTDQVRLTMSLQQSRETLMQVDETNKWVRTVSNFVLWSVGLGLGARLGSAILSGFEYGAARLHAKATEALKSLTFKANPVKWTGYQAVRRGSALFEGVFQQSAVSLRRLLPTETLDAKNPAVYFLKESGWATLNAAKGQAAFTGVSGFISGGFTVGQHLWDGSEESNFKDSGDAFHQGFVGGVHWANESWHPALGYVGIPSTVFEGTKWAGVTETIGSRGVLGMTGQVISKFGGRRIADFVGAIERNIFKAYENTYAGGNLFKKAFGYGRELVGISVGTLDQVAKFALFSSAVSGVAKFTRTNFLDQDEPDLERRIKRINQEGNWWLESAVWLALPQFAAVHAEAASGYQNSIQGYEGYKKAGRLHELANVSGPEAMKPHLTSIHIPLSQRIFQPRFKRGDGGEKRFSVGDELKRKAIAEVLLESVPGGGKGAKLENLDPFEFFRISQLDPDGPVKKYGKLNVTQDLQLAAHNNFTEALRRNQKLAAEVLSAKPGSTLHYKIDGKDYELVVTPKVRKEVADCLLVEARLDARPKELRPGEEKKDRGAKISKELEALSEKVLDLYLKADDVPPFADRFMKAMRELTGGSKAEIEAFTAAMEAMEKEVNAWKDAKGQDYLPLLAKLRAEAKAKLAANKLTAQQHGVFEALYDYVAAIEKRFNAFNNVETAHTLVKEEIDALQTQYATHPGKNKAAILALLAGYSAKLDRWYRAEAGKVASQEALKTLAVDSPGQKDFGNLIAGFQSELEGLAKSGKLSRKESDSLMSSVSAMRASPWALHNVKGDALKGWRPEQFQGLMITLAGVAKDGRGGGIIREFTRLKTGGGKTLLMFEGLLPLAEADVRYHRGRTLAARALSTTGKVLSGRFSEIDSGPQKVTFLTVQGNLEAQAKLDFIALKKVRSELEFGTYESFKSEIAESKSQGKKLVERHWILGDEMDGAALQPALTLGQTTGKIGRWDSIFNMIDKFSGSMETLLGRQSKELSEGASNEVSRAQRALEGLDASHPEVAAANLASARLFKSVEKLATALTPEARLLAETAIKENVSELREALDAQSLSSSVETQAGLYQKASDIKRLADTVGVDPLASIQISSLLKQQEALLTGAKTPQARAFRKTVSELRARLQKGGDAAELVDAVKETVVEQQGLLAPSEAVPAKEKAEVEAALRKVSEILSAPKPDAASEKLLVQTREDIHDGVKRAVRQQKNLLGLISGREAERLERLRQKAKEQLEAAETRVEKLSGRREELVKKKQSAPEKDQARLDEQVKALEAELKLAEGDVKRSQRFAGAAYGRAQKLIERISELKNDELAAARTELDALRARLSDKEKAELDAYVPGKKGPDKELQRELAGKKGAERLAILERARQKALARSKTDLGRAEALVEKGAEAADRLAASEKELGELRDGVSDKEKAGLDDYALGVEVLQGLGRKMRDVDAKLVEASRKGEPTDALTTELLELDGKAGRARVQLGKLRHKALESVGAKDLGAARDQLQKSAEEISALAEKGDYAEASRLLARQRELLEAFGKLENPIYGTYREMKEETHYFAHGRAWNRDIVEEVGKSRESSGRLIDQNVAALEKAVKDLQGSASSGETAEAKAAREKAEGLLGSQLEVWRKLQAYGEKASDLSASIERLDAQISYAEKKLEDGDAFAAERAARKAELEALRQEVESLAPGAGFTGRFPEFKGRGEAGRLVLLDYVRTAKELALRQETARSGLLKSLKAEGPLALSFKELTATTRSVVGISGIKDPKLRPHTGLEGELSRLEMTETKTVELLRKRIEGDGLFSLLGKVLTGRPLAIDNVGLVRKYAWKLLKGVLRDPVMPLEQRQRMFWYLFASLVRPQSSQVHEEILNMIQGHFDDPQTIRMDNLSGNTHVVHNGSWFETMDNPTRRFWELHFGTDITLPYTHKALSTIKDLSSNPRARFISLSATAGKAVQRYMTESGVRLAGPETAAPKGIRMRMAPGGAAKMDMVGSARELAAKESKERTAFRPSEVLMPEENLKVAPKNVQNWIKDSGLKIDEALKLAAEDKLPDGVPADVRQHLETINAVHEYLTKTDLGPNLGPLSKVKEISRRLDQILLEAAVLFPEAQFPGKAKAVRDYFEYLRGDETMGLTVLSVSGTRELKVVREFLLRTGLKEDEIAQVISDSEYLRVNRPEANVHETMNLKGMVEGRVKVLILDTRVGGRGLDLDYKGDRTNSNLKAFKGYTNYEMLVIDPHEMSAVHLLQAMGRIDVGRVLMDAPRNFALLMDVQGVQKEPFFQDMFHEHPLFLQLRDDPKILDFAKTQGKKVDWALIDAYMKDFEVQRVKELEQTPADLEMRQLQELFNQPKDLEFVRDFLLFKEEAALMKLKDDPAVLEFAAGRKSEVTPRLIRDYLRHNEGAAEKAGIKAELDFVARYTIVERYEAVVKEYLEAKQNEVEENQLKSSSVLNEPIVDKKMGWFNKLSGRDYEGAKKLKR